MNGQEHYELAEQLLAGIDANDAERFLIDVERQVGNFTTSAELREFNLTILAAARTHAELASAAMLADFLRTAVSIAEVLNRVLFDADGGLHR